MLATAFLISFLSGGEGENKESRRMHILLKEMLEVAVDARWRAGILISIISISPEVLKVVLESSI